MNFIEVNYLRSLVRVTRMDRVRYEGVNKSSGIERALTSEKSGSENVDMVGTRGENVLEYVDGRSKCNTTAIEWSHRYNR